jgi:glycosyltransferase involved in cell wall biosynthesis
MQPPATPQPTTDSETPSLGRRGWRWVKRRLRTGREILHWATISRWHWYPADLPEFLKPADRPPSRAEPRVAYFIWHFPVLSQTFVRREIEALRKHGLSIEVFAEAAEDIELLGESEKLLLTTTRYLLPIDEDRLARYRRELHRERALVYWHVYAFIMSRRYGLTKKLGRDRSLFEQAVYLAGAFRELGITRVHSPWGDRAGFAAMLAARLLGLPFSLQVRAHDLHDPNYHPALRLMLPAADFIITNTQYNRPFIQALMPNGGPDIHTIYNGIDLTQFVPPDRAARAPGPTRILCVARLVEQKGLTFLLDACALMRERNIPFTCEIIGGTEEPLYSEYWKSLQEKHRHLELQDTVFFRGARPFAAIMEAYRDADIFALPCVVAQDGRRDITPNAVIEAMAMKLPVVSTPVTGVSEIVEHGTSGLLVPPGDAVALADGIERLIRNPELAHLLGEGARRRIECRFDAERNVTARLGLFHPSSGPARNPVLAS